MAIDFPNSPTLNQKFSAGGNNWQWDGVAWNVLPGFIPPIASDVPPVNPSVGQFWWRGTNGRLYIYIDDGNSKQWVEASGQGGPPLSDAGKIDWFAMQTPPPGWLKANGAGVLRSIYVNLDAAIYCGDSLNPTASFGYHCTDPVNTTTTRNIAGLYIALPEMRGESQRGWDDGRGVDGGRLFGSTQQDAIQNIQGRFKAAPTTGGMDGMSGVFAQSGSGNYTQGSSLIENAGVGYADFNASRVVRAGSETRVRNVALLACIKY
jgi:phage-related tail fiber protein